MRGDEAKKVCPEIQLIQVPVAHGKADLTAYRDAGSEVVAVLARKGRCERASIDEVYLDITEASSALLSQEPLYAMQSIPEEVLKTHILGCSVGDEERSSMARQWLCRREADQKDQMLACAAVVIAELRMEVLAETTFTCSAGIAHNKMLAKLASGMHKPAQQTLVPFSSVFDLLAALPIKKMRQLGGKLGDSLQTDLGVHNVGDLLQFSESKLQELYGVNTGTWLWNTARGMSGDEVKARTLPKSHSCGKTFPGPQALRNLVAVEHWLGQLAAELQERLDVNFEQNHRTAHLLTMHAGTNHGYKVSQERKFPSKSCVLRYGKEKIAQDAIRLFERGLHDFCSAYRMSPGKRDGTTICSWAITSLFIGASNILATPAGMNPITRFFPSPTSPNASLVQESFGLSSPSVSPTASSFWEEPLSPHAAQSSGDEAIDVACRKGNIFDTGRGSLGSLSCLEGNKMTCSTGFIEETINLKQSEETEENNHSLPLGPLIHDVRDCKVLSHSHKLTVANEERTGNTGTSGSNHLMLSHEQLVALQDHFKDGDDSYAKGCEQTSVYSDKRHDHHGDKAIVGFDSDEVLCTPTFGNFGGVKTLECNFQLTGDNFGSSYHDLSIASSDALETCLLESSVKTPPLVIHCSPVEDEADAHVVKRAGKGFKFQEMETEKESGGSYCTRDHGKLQNELSVQRMREPPLTSTAVGSQQSGLLKLEDIWQRKAANALRNERTETSSDTGWKYKPGEIDEAVLSELPEEIQEELYRTLGLKRSRTVKRSTIGDFFRSSVSDASN